LELWATVLNEENPYREKMVEKVISHALPDSKRVEEVSTTVKAFHAAQLYSQLIGLLENIVLHNSEFSNYEKL
jgi:clathrin heavy chain